MTLILANIFFSSPFCQQQKEKERRIKTLIYDTHEEWKRIPTKWGIVIMEFYSRHYYYHLWFNQIYIIFSSLSSSPPIPSHKRWQVGSLAIKVRRTMKYVCKRQFENQHNLYRLACWWAHSFKRRKKYQFGAIVTGK